MNRWTFFLQTLLATALLVLLLFSLIGHNWRPVWEYRQLLFLGWIITVGLSLGSLA